MLVARITFLTLRTCDLVRALCEEGVLELSPRVFKVEVTVTDTRKERPGQVMYAPVGTTEPAGIDEPFGPKWQTFTADDAAKAHEATKGETSCSHHRKVSTSPKHRPRSWTTLSSRQTPWATSCHASR
jgi:hypothetical protein